jgi:hypothetical protein
MTTGSASTTSTLARTSGRSLGPVELPIRAYRQRVIPIVTGLTASQTTPQTDWAAATASGSAPRENLGVTRLLVGAQVATGATFCVITSCHTCVRCGRSPRRMNHQHLRRVRKTILLRVKTATSFHTTWRITLMPRMRARRSEGCSLALWISKRMTSSGITSFHESLETSIIGLVITTAVQRPSLPGPVAVVQHTSIGSSIHKVASLSRITKMLTEQKEIASECALPRPTAIITLTTALQLFALQELGLTSDANSPTPVSAKSHVLVLSPRHTGHRWPHLVPSDFYCKFHFLDSALLLAPPGQQADTANLMLLPPPLPWLLSPIRYPDPLNPGISTCYLFSLARSTWPDASLYCEFIGGRLADIESEEEDNFLKAHEVGSILSASYVRVCSQAHTEDVAVSPHRFISSIHWINIGSAFMTTMAVWHGKVPLGYIRTASTTHLHLGS